MGGKAEAQEVHTNAGKHTHSQIQKSHQTKSEIMIYKHRICKRKEKPRQNIMKLETCKKYHGVSFVLATFFWSRYLPLNVLCRHSENL